MARIDFFFSVGSTYSYLALMRADAVAALGMMEGWGKEYIVTSARRWFEFREEPGGVANMEASLAVVGQERQAVLARAAAPEVEARLDGETVAARELGIFGAPSFAVGRELFWGNDRLEHAIAWVKTGRVG